MVLMGSWIGWQVKVEALLKVVHSVTHAVPKVDRRKMLRRTEECDVCTANGVGCLDRCSGQRRLKGNGVKMGDAQHCLVFAPTLIKKKCLTNQSIDQSMLLDFKKILFDNETDLLGLAKKRRSLLLSYFNRIRLTQAGL